MLVKKSLFLLLLIAIALLLFNFWLMINQRNESKLAENALKLQNKNIVLDAIANRDSSKKMQPNPNDSLRKMFIDKLKKNGFVAVENSSKIKIHLVYASDSNFLKRNMYRDFNTCFMQKITANKLEKAAELLQASKPNYKVVVYDAYRPKYIQHEFWNVVKGTPQQQYVANPAKGSMHNFGLALDVSIVNAQDEALDMGTGFDDFTKLAQPRYENQYLKQGVLKMQQVENRKLLRKIMLEAGFENIPNEWWHYNAASRKTANKSYKIF